MSFQTSCMVLVNDEQQQIELEKWMTGIEWRILGGRKDDRRFLVAEAGYNAAIWLRMNESALEYFGHDFHNCGEDIELFKALAAMNDDNDREQWFIAHAVVRFNRLKETVQTEKRERLIMAGDWFKVLISRASSIRAKWMAFVKPSQSSHKATKEEIVEHFNKSTL